jgi:putative FmdB family regulatory protein
MPTYRYRCPKCGQEYEKLQKISDTTLAKCPKCGTRGERMITGGAGLVFKGSGFYITDYKRKAESKTGDDAAKKDAPATAPKDKTGRKDSQGGSKSGGDS